MNEHLEDRLRRALAARAEQVTPATLRPEPPVEPRRRARVTWVAPVLAAAAVAAVLVAGVTYAVIIATGGQPAPGPAATPDQRQVVTGGSCAHESALVAAALRRRWVPADVDGDGVPDRLAVAVDEGGRAGCRTFLGVRTSAGTTYSSALPDATATPLPFPPEVIGVPDLGDDAGSEIVVDTHARADGALSLLYTLTDSGLVRVRVPGSRDGSFIVEGGGVTAPHGAGCDRAGALVLSTAQMHGQRFEVTRRVFTLDGYRLVPESSRTHDIPADDLARRFPEFVGPHFAACDGVLRPGR